MASKARFLAVAVVLSQGYLNEALSFGSSVEAEAEAYHAERIRHHSALTNISRHMTVERALKVFQDRPGAPQELVNLVHRKLGKGHAHHSRHLRHAEISSRSEPDGEEEPYGKGVLRAKDMLNDMIYEVQKQYEIEHHKCCDYEHTKKSLIEDAAQDIALFNAESAQARAEILDATGQIGICEEKIPRLRNSLAEHNRKCTEDIEALEHELSEVTADKEVMESLSDSADCDKLAAAAAPVSLLQCLHPCTQEPHILFANSTMRNIVSRLRSKTAKHLLQHSLEKARAHGQAGKHRTVSALLQEQLENEMVEGFNAKLNSTAEPMGAKPAGPCKRAPPTDTRSSKCTLGPGSCEIIAERLLTIHSAIIDKGHDLQQEIKKLDGTCKEVKKSFESQINDFSTQLVDQQAKLAASTKVQNTADEQNRLKTAEKSDMEKEFREMTETCHKNYQSFEDQECGLKKIRGELFRMKAPEASGVFEDCQLSEWSMGECSASCQGGTQTLTRTVVTAAKGGVKCLPLERVQPCNTQKCPVDCKVADWQSWSGCTAECGGGIMQRGRAVNVKAKYGGKPCGETSEVRSCNLQSCNADCQLGAWTGWSGCSKACGGGRQRRFRFIEEAARGTGSCPKEKDESRLQYQECNTQACSAGLECQSELDVVLLLDGSSRVGDEGWEAVKTAGEYLVRALGSSGRVKLSVILFAGPKTLHGLSKCTNEDPTAPPPDMAKDCSIEVVSKLTSNTADLLAKVKELKYPKGSALTSAALSAAEAELALGRKDANSVVLLLTRGKPLSIDKTTLMAQRLKKKARVMWVPVTGFEKLDHFQQWSSDPDDENVIVMKDWAQLKDPKTTDEIISYMCPGISSKAFVPTPTHEWNFRGCSGDVKDAQSALVAKVTGKCNSDGVYLDSGFVTYDNFPLGATFAIEAYVKYHDFKGRGSVFFTGGEPGNEIMVSNFDGNTGLVQVNRAGALMQRLTKPNFWSEGQWQHIVGTAGNGAVKLYSNGVLVEQKGGLTDTQVLTRSQTFSGKDPWGAGMHAALASLRVWNGVAIGDDIVAAMFKTEVSFCSKSKAGQSAVDDGCPNLGTKEGVKQEKCEDYCRATQFCTGFDFHAETGFCVLRACIDPNKPFLESLSGSEYFGLCKAAYPYCRVTDMNIAASDEGCTTVDYVDELGWDACQLKCSQNAECNGINFGHENGSCKLLKCEDPTKPKTSEVPQVAFYRHC